MKYNEVFELIGPSEDPGLELIENTLTSVRTCADSRRTNAASLEAQALKLRKEAALLDEEGNRLQKTLAKLKS